MMRAPVSVAKSSFSLIFELVLSDSERTLAYMEWYFFDTGKVYEEDENIKFNPGDLRQSAGGGVRWVSPMGPIDIEYGYILDQKDSDHGPGQIEFSMASSF